MQKISRLDLGLVQIVLVALPLGSGLLNECLKIGLLDL